MGMNEQELLVPADVAEQYQKEFDQLMVVKDDTEDLVNSAITTAASIEIANEPFYPRNRAERRAQEKTTRRQKQKKRRIFIDNISQAAEKLAYINMIEKIRTLNEQIKQEGEKENEAND